MFQFSKEDTSCLFNYICFIKRLRWLNKMTKEYNVITLIVIQFKLNVLFMVYFLEINISKKLPREIINQNYVL